MLNENDGLIAMEWNGGRCVKSLKTGLNGKKGWKTKMEDMLSKWVGNCKPLTNYVLNFTTFLKHFKVL